MIQAYLTAYYAREWGNLIGQGLELSQIFSMMQEQKIPAFSGNWKGFSSFFRPWPVLFRDGQGGILFSKKELPLMIEYGEVKSKLGNELEIYAEKNMGRFLSSGSQGHECDTTLGVCLCGSCDCLTLCSHVAADLSKYGGSFMKKLKTYKVKAFTLIEMLVVLLIISVLLLLFFVPNLTKQKTP